MATTDILDGRTPYGDTSQSSLPSAHRPSFLFRCTFSNGDAVYVHAPGADDARFVAAFQAWWVTDQWWEVVEVTRVGSAVTALDSYSREAGSTPAPATNKEGR